MCGIAGMLSLNDPGRIGLEPVRRMIARLTHRGPDESGLYRDAWIGMGNARLSILDLAGGAQPIGNEDGTLWIVVNGEVFNYVELREELAARGHRFTTTTDSEVILHLYEELGPACLERLNGQFAIAIWNAAERRLFLARDRVGICPLHYAIHDGMLLFGSEIKAIFAVDGFPRRFDPVAIDQIFTFWTTLPGRTAFEGVRELPPGHYLLTEDGDIAVRRYWDIPFAPPGELLDWPPERICDEIQSLLIDAVRIRLRADVPVGCYVSGGLDSSGIASLIVRHFDGDVRTFGIRFEDARFDEGVHQQRMVEHLGVRHAEVRVANEEIGAHFADALWHAERPLLRTAPVPLYLLSRRVREAGYKVVLTGEGADEVFGGYNIFREMKVRRFWAREPDSKCRPRLIGRLYPYIFDDPRLARMLQSFFATGMTETGNPFYSHAIRWNNTARTRAFLSEDIRATSDPLQYRDELAARLPAGFDRLEPLARAQYLEMMIFLGNYLLSSQGDRVAMAHSVEIRIPFLDHRLIEFMGRVPARWKIRGLDEKHILKRSFTGVVPDEIRARPKHPFRAPIGASLLGGTALAAADGILSESSLRAAGIFDPARVALLLRKARASDNLSEVDSMALAGILSTQVLHERFIANYDAVTLPDRKPDRVIDSLNRPIQEARRVE